MSEILLSIQNLRTYFHTFKGVVKAVDGIDFDLHRNEILGIVGESGSGKTVANLSAMKLIDEPGIVEADGIYLDGVDISKKSEREMSKIRGKDISMIFQDPMTSLNPLYTIQKQMEEVLILHTKLNKEERRQKCIELLRQVGIPNPENRLKDYPHQFSGGMRQRVIIAIALATNSKIIIADEPTTALDVTVQYQVLELLKDLVREQNASMIFITHDLAVVSQITDRIIVMYCGKIIEEGATVEVIHHPKHPYTEGLLSSIPRLREDKPRLDQIPGMVPNMFEMPKGCSFSPRCKYCQELCQKEEPVKIEHSAGHFVACHYPLGGVGIE